MRENFDENGIYINYVGKWKVRKTDYGGGRCERESDTEKERKG